LRFRRFGKTCQLSIRSAEDLEDVLALDESLWVATSAPVSAFRCDPVFLALVDTNSDARIRTHEVKEAIRWLMGRLADRSRLADGVGTLPLTAVRQDSPEGARLADSARFILRSLGEESAETISLEQVRRYAAGVKGRPLNGDGIIPPGATGDPETTRFIEDVLACTGGAEDSSGCSGISEAQLDRFMQAAADYIDWRAEGDLAGGETATALMPLGDATPGAFAVYEPRRDKVDVFFELCRAVRFDSRAESLIGWHEPALEGLQPAEPGAVRAYLEQVPLAKPALDGLLPLDEEAINPLHRDWMAALKRDVLVPVLGEVPERLSEADWGRVKATLAPYEAYLREKKGALVESLPLERLREYRDGPFAQRTRELIEADRAVANVLEGVRQVERLLLYHKHLMRLANNFVSFPELYSAGQRAMFEMGSAVIDGRWFNFAVRADDLAAHSAIARTSNIFVFYLEVADPAAGGKWTVAVPATSGSRGNLTAGKRGVFFDTNGRGYDAQVVHIIENPVSLSEAMTAPFRRMWTFITGKIEAFYGAVDKKLQSQLEQAVAAVQPAAAPTAAAGPGSRAGLMVGLGVAAAALGSALAFIAKTVAEVGLYRISLGLVGAVLVVMIPLVLIAAMKLRRQDLSALLEGCGWAVNARMRMNRQQRKMFTTYGAYPEGAKGTPLPRWVGTAVRIVIAVVLLAGAYWGARALADYWERKEAEQGEESVEQDGTETPAAGGQTDTTPSP